MSKPEEAATLNASPFLIAVMGMSESKGLWYRLGYLTASSRDVGRPRAVPKSNGRLQSIRELVRARVAERVAGHDPGQHGTSRSKGELSGSHLASYVLDQVGPRANPGASGYLRGALAGAGAALAVEIARRIVEEGPAGIELDDLLIDRILAGVAEGLLYAALVRPSRAGGAAAKGGVWGALNHLLAPLGGLRRLLARRSPVSSVPGLGKLLHRGPDVLEDAALVENVVEGVVLALLYGSRDASRGTTGDV